MQKQSEFETPGHQDNRSGPIEEIAMMNTAQRNRAKALDDSSSSSDSEEVEQLFSGEEPLNASFNM